MVEGFHYFVRRGNPVYRGWHSLWSRDWVTDSYRFEDPPLGEWGGKRQFYSGDPPPERPLPKLVGSAECIEHGISPYVEPRSPTPADLCRMLPFECYPVSHPTDAKTVFNACGWACVAAQLIKVAYTDLDLAERMALLYFGDTATITKFPERPLVLPAMLGIQQAGRSFLLITGTSNLWQGVLQGFSYHDRPINFGTFLAPNFQVLLAIRCLNRARAMLTPWPTRVQFLGHSLGGALAVVCTLLTHRENPERRPELVTFACPKITDQRGIDILADLDQTHWRNESDPVPFLPPDPFANGWIFPLIPDLLILLWSNYAAYDNCKILLDAGGIQDAQSTQIAQDVAITLGLLIAAGVAPDPFDVHFTEEYVARLKAACECCPDLEGRFGCLIDLFHVKVENVRVSHGGIDYDVNFETDLAIYQRGLEYDIRAKAEGVGDRGYGVFMDGNGSYANAFSLLGISFFLGDTGDFVSLDFINSQNGCMDNKVMTFQDLVFFAAGVSGGTHHPEYVTRTGKVTLNPLPGYFVVDPESAILPAGESPTLCRGCLGEEEFPEETTEGAGE